MDDLRTILQATVFILELVNGEISNFVITSLIEMGKIFNKLKNKVSSIIYYSKIGINIIRAF